MRNIKINKIIVFGAIISLIINMVSCLFIKYYEVSNPYEDSYVISELIDDIYLGNAYFDSERNNISFKEALIKEGASLKNKEIKLEDANYKTNNKIYIKDLTNDNKGIVTINGAGILDKDSEIDAHKSYEDGKLDYYIKMKFDNKGKIIILDYDGFGYNHIENMFASEYYNLRANELFDGLDSEKTNRIKNKEIIIYKHNDGIKSYRYTAMMEANISCRLFTWGIFINIVIVFVSILYFIYIGKYKNNYIKIKWAVVGIVISAWLSIFTVYENKLFFYGDNLNLGSFIGENKIIQFILEYGPKFMIFVCMNYFVLNLISAIYYKNKDDLREQNLKLEDLKKYKKSKLKFKVFNLIVAIITIIVICSSIYSSIYYNESYLIVVIMICLVILVLLIISFSLIRKRYGELNDELISGELKCDNSLEMFSELKGDIRELQDKKTLEMEESIESENSKVELISNISHDLKTPLTSIIAFADLLKYEEDDDKKREYIKIINEKGKRLKKLVEEFREINLSDYNIELKEEKIELKTMVLEIIENLEDHAKGRNIKFEIKEDKDKKYICADRQMIERAIENLLINGVKYSKNNSKVEIDIYGESDIYLKIKNLTEEKINYKKEDIVKRFKRGDNSRSTEGSGLGLAIAKNFIQINNGKLNIELEENKFIVVVEFKK